MRKVSQRSGKKRGGITLRIVLEHMQHLHNQTQRELKKLRSEMNEGFAEVSRIGRSVRNIEAQLDDVEIEKMPGRLRRLEEKVGLPISS